MLVVSATLARLYRTLLRAKLPVLWCVLAVAVAALLYKLEDPFLKRV